MASDHISRGFTGRRRETGDPARMPPGQYLTRDFPVLSAGPTPHTSLDEWSFTVDGAVDAARTWTWEEFLALPLERRPSIRAATRVASLRLRSLREGAVAMTTQLQTEQGIVRVPSGTWTVDPSHSGVGFEVRHMMIATVRGQFREFEGAIVAAEDLAESRVAGKATAASIDTGQADRDAHLRSADFFDAEHFPEIAFESARIEHVEGGMFRVVGDLTIRDQTHEIALATVVQGAGEDPWGNERVGLQARAVINRTAFGLNWQQRVARGGVLVGDEVTLVLDVSAVRVQE